MPEHRGEKPAIVFLLRQALPFFVCRDPGTQVFPAMQVGEHLRAYLLRSELPHDRERYRPAELIQRPMREFRATGGSYSTRAELKVIALADAPSVKRGPWEDEPQRIADAPDFEFHADVIT